MASVGLVSAVAAIAGAAWINQAWQRPASSVGKGINGDAAAAEQPDEPSAEHAHDVPAQLKTLAPLLGPLAYLVQSPLQRTMRWWHDYQHLLDKARALQRRDAEEAAASQRNGVSGSGDVGGGGRGWRVSPIQAVRNLQEVFTDANTRRLLAETAKRTPWTLVLIILCVSLGGSWIAIRRAAVMAQIFDTLMAAAATASATASSTSSAAAAVAADTAASTAAHDAAWATVTHALTTYVVLQLLDEVIDIAAILLTDELRSRIELQARRAFYASVLSQDISFLDSQRMTDMQRHMQDAPSAIHDAALVPARLVRYAATFAAGIYSMCAVDWQLTVAAWLFRTPITLNFSSISVGVLGLHWRLAEDLYSRSAAQVGEALANVRLVQIHAAEELEARAYGRFIQEGYAQARTLRVVEKLLARLQNLFYMLWDAGSLMFAVYRIMHGHMTLGAFNAFKTYQSTAASAFEALLHETGRLRTSARKCETFFEVLDRHPAVLHVADDDDGGAGSAAGADVNGVGDASEATSKSVAGAVGVSGGSAPSAAASTSPSLSALVPRTLRHIRGAVMFEGVTFRYPQTRGNSASTTDTLRGISFHIPAGSTAAFVGRSGSGKSTIMRLLIRFYDPAAGSVHVDGEDIRNLDARWLRRRIGFVEQEPVMLNRSIRDNICYGFERGRGGVYPTEEEVISAARRAHIHDTITTFPDGYDTIVGDRGVRLSGGEKQRIAVARAFVRDPRILLLDEPTAALDADSETAVKAGIDELMKGRTVLIVAHRLRTVQQCDCIFVVDEGAIVERGSHAELMRLGGAYASLVRQQVLLAAEEGGEGGEGGGASISAVGGGGGTCARADRGGGCA